MRNFLEEIEKLRTEVESIDKELARLLYTKTVYNLSKTLSANKLPSKVNILTISNSDKLYNDLLEVLQLTDICERLEEEERRLKRKRGYTLFRIEQLRQEYYKAHSTDFYCLMDEIDICNHIEKDGYIIGIKF